MFAYTHVAVPDLSRTQHCNDVTSVQWDSGMQLMGSGRFSMGMDGYTGMGMGQVVIILMLGCVY